MADSVAFERAAEELEKCTGLDRLASRGTLRLALKSIGLDSKSATPYQVRTIVEKMLPQELASRGFANAAALCAKVCAALADVADTGPGQSAMEILQRISGSGGDTRR